MDVHANQPRVVLRYVHSLHFVPKRNLRPQHVTTSQHNHALNTRHRSTYKLKVAPHVLGRRVRRYPFHHHRVVVHLTAPDHTHTVMPHITSELSTARGHTVMILRFAMRPSRLSKNMSHKNAARKMMEYSMSRVA